MTLVCQSTVEVVIGLVLIALGMSAGFWLVPLVGLSLSTIVAFALGAVGGGIFVLGVATKLL